MTGNGLTPVTVRWTEDGKVQQRTLHVPQGTVVNSEAANKKYTVAASNGQTPVWNMTKADAYVLLGASHAHETDKDPRYQLDKKDMEVFNQEWYNSRNNMEGGQLQINTTVRSGTGAGHINSAFINKEGEYVVTHGPKDNRLSIFIKE